MEDGLLSMNCDPQAQLLLLDSWVNTAAEELAAVTVPVLVLTGTGDTETAAGKALADGVGEWHAYGLGLGALDPVAPVRRQS
jgi:hypothetical protein